MGMHDMYCIDLIALDLCDRPVIHSQDVGYLRVMSVAQTLYCQVVV
jgi:hypothetical protein